MPTTSNRKRTQTIESVVQALRHFIVGVILYNQRVAEQVGVHSTDLQCLHVLVLLGPVTPGTLAECTGLTTGGITVVLDRLEKAGYTRRERNPADRRSVLIYLQPEKLQELGPYYDAITKEMNTHLTGFSERELETVLEFFSKMNSIRGDQTKFKDAKNL